MQAITMPEPKPEDKTRQKAVLSSQRQTARMFRSLLARQVCRLVEPPMPVTSEVTELDEL